MRTETTTRTLYLFNELSDKAKQKAIEKLWDINVDYDWWDSAYEDAANIGLKITGFDLGRAQSITGDFTELPENVIANILKDHGETGPTVHTAMNYKATIWEDEEGDRSEDAEHELLNDLLQDYWIMLRNEYEYLISEAAIVETIEANEYEFTENGEMA